MSYTVKRNDYLMHHGIKGQKWGVRRYQHSDGSLTAEGRKRYLNSDGTLTEAGKKRYFDQNGNLSDKGKKTLFEKDASGGRVNENSKYAADIIKNDKTVKKFIEQNSESFAKSKNAMYDYFEEDNSYDKKLNSFLKENNVDDPENPKRGEYEQEFKKNNPDAYAALEKAWNTEISAIKDYRYESESGRNTVNEYLLSYSDQKVKNVIDLEDTISLALNRLANDDFEKKYNRQMPFYND